jgi:hypothetical protein
MALLTGTLVKQFLLILAKVEVHLICDNNMEKWAALKSIYGADDTKFYNWIKKTGHTNMYKHYPPKYIHREAHTIYFASLD